MPTEKSISNNCLKVSIGGYIVIVDPKRLIIDTDPKLKSLQYQNLDNVFKRLKKRATFSLVEKVPYPMIVSNDTYNELIKQNPIIGYLVEKFDCELF